MSRLFTSAIAVSVLLAGAAFGGQGSVWRWTDESGAVHITGRFEDVPEAYRPGAVRMNLSTATEAPKKSFPKPEPLDAEKFLRFELSDGMVSITAVFDGTVKRGAWIDTGSELTIITTKLATALGYDFRKADNQTFHTPNGRMTAPVVVLKNVRVGPAMAADVPAAVMDFPGRGPVSAIVGMNFLSLFPFEINMRDKTIVFGAGMAGELPDVGRDQSSPSLKNAEER